jgi:hypothetical protein
MSKPPSSGAEKPSDFEAADAPAAEAEVIAALGRASHHAANDDAGDAVGDIGGAEERVMHVAEVHVVGIGAGAVGKVISAEILDTYDNVARGPVATHGDRADLRNAGA